jgi:hypothetical protein
MILPPSGTIVPQIVHRPAVFDDQERDPFRTVLCQEYPYSENQGKSFDGPENLVKDFLVAGYGFVVGDVSEEPSHGLLSRGAGAAATRIAVPEEHQPAARLLATETGCTQCVT